MSPLRMFFGIFVLLSSCSLVSTAGHLRLELTSSNNCEIRLITVYSKAIIKLNLGEKTTTSFHPPLNEDTVRVGLQYQNAVPVFYNFSLKNTGQQLRSLFEASDIVILLQSVYECDVGFYGPKCQFKGIPTTSSTTTTTTTTTTVTTTTETKKPEQTSTVQPLKKTTPIPAENYSNVIIVILVFIIITLTGLIIVFGILLVSSRAQHIIIADTTQEFGKEKEFFAEKKCKDLNESDMGEPRYSADPFETKFAQKTEF